MTPTRTRKSLTVAAGDGHGRRPRPRGVQQRRRARQHHVDGGGGSGGGGNTGYTFAMITHETPGDTFWDQIKAGATQAAKDTGITLKYSNDPDAGQAGDADPERHRLQGRRHRHDPGHPGRPRPVRSRRPTTPASRSTPSTPASTSSSRRRPDVLRLRREARRSGGRQAHRRRRCHQDPLHHPADRVGGPRGPLRRRQGRRFPNTENIQVNGADDAAGHDRHPGQAHAGQVDQLDRHPRRAAGPRRHQGDSDAPGRTSRSARSTPTRTRPRRSGRQDPVVHRPAALPAGLHGHHASSTSTRRTATSSVAARPC